MSPERKNKIDEFVNKFAELTTRESFGQHFLTKTGADGGLLKASYTAECLTDVHFAVFSRKMYNRIQERIIRRVENENLRFF